MSSDSTTWAPELGHVNVSVDAACKLSVVPAITHQTELLQDDYLYIYLDTDGRFSSGQIHLGGADRAVRITGRNGPDEAPALGRWDASQGTFTWTTNPSLRPVGIAGFEASIESLDIAPGAAIGVRVSAMTIYGSEVLSDLAPDSGAPSFRHTVNYSTSPPAPPPPPLPPPPPPPPPPEMLTARLKYDYVARRRNTVLPTLSVKSAPVGAEIVITCKGRRCPRRRAAYPVKKPGTVILKAFRGTKLRAGSRLEVRISKPGAVTLVKRVTIRAKKRPIVVHACLAPGASKPYKC